MSPWFPKRIQILFFATAVTVGITMGIVGCKSKMGPEQTQTKSGDSWPMKMQSVAEEVSRLIPYIYSQKEFHDPSNFTKISTELKKFAGSVHAIPQDMGKKVLGDDPVVTFSLDRLQKDIRLASESFESGHTEYSRSLLRGSLNHCFRCHTRTEQGPENSGFKVDYTKLRISPTERADLYVALRQYDKALEILESVLNDSANFYDDPYEQERALKRYLAVMVRVRKDPAPAIATLEKFIAKPNLAFYLAEDSRQWLKSLKEWRTEKTSKQTAMEQAKDLIKRAGKLQSSQSQQSADVLYLRASALLHVESIKAQPGLQRASLFSLLGRSYDALADLGFWNLHEIYFEACIREAPKSEVAKECYKDFERSVFWGFSGSAGTFIPRNEMDRLVELKKVSGLN